MTEEGKRTRIKKSKNKSKFKNFFGNFPFPKGIKLDINLDNEHTLNFEIGKNKSSK